MILRSKPRSTVTYPKAEPAPSSPDPHRWGLRMFLGKPHLYLNTDWWCGLWFSWASVTHLSTGPSEKIFDRFLLEPFTLCLLDKLHWLSPYPLWLPGSALSEKTSMLLPAAALCPGSHSHLPRCCMALPNFSHCCSQLMLTGQAVNLSRGCRHTSTKLALLCGQSPSGSQRGISFHSTSKAHSLHVPKIRAASHSLISP